MTTRTHSLLLTGLLLAATAAAGCGSDDKPAAKTASERPAKVDLAQFLMRDDEQPGFRRVESIITETGVATFAKTNSLPPADARRLRRDGFISITVQPIDGPGTRGVTNVQLFKTASGARDWLAAEQRATLIHGIFPGAKIRRFTVPGIPGARGWAAADVGNVHWVQGRCLLVLGNQGAGPFAAPLATGARAIYKRTQGQCPGGSR